MDTRTVTVQRGSMIFRQSGGELSLALARTGRAIPKGREITVGRAFMAYHDHKYKTALPLLSSERELEKTFYVLAEEIYADPIQRLLDGNNDVPLYQIQEMAFQDDDVAKALHVLVGGRSYDSLSERGKLIHKKLDSHPELQGK